MSGLTQRSDPFLTRKLSSFYFDSEDANKREENIADDKSCWIEQLAGCPESFCQAMLIAARNNDVVSLKKILKLADVRPNTYIEPETGRSTFWYACSCGSNDVLRYLISLEAKSGCFVGTEPASTDRDDGVDVYWKSESDECQSEVQNKDKMDMISARSASGTSPLHIAVGMGHVSTVSLLVQLGADINEVNEHGTSPITLAVDRNHLDVLSLLLEQGADANKLNYTGTSSIHVACKNGRVDALKRLYFHGGVDFQQINGEGMTCIAIACQYNHMDVLTYLCSIANHPTLSCPKPPDVYQLTKYTFSNIIAKQHTPFQCHSLLDITSLENKSLFHSIIRSSMLRLDKEKGVIKC